jgi:plastocyanin
MRPTRLPEALALLTAIALAALSWGEAGSVARTAGAQGTVVVTVGDFFFCDPSLVPGACQTVVSVGDTVVWEYRTGSEGHTVTHCGESCDAPTGTPLWDSGGLSPGQSFSYTFSEPGTYRYLCRFHPDAMRAVVLVEAPPTAAPTEPPASPTPSVTGEASPRLAPTQAVRSPTASPTSAPSATPTPSSSAQDEDDGISYWVLILVGVGGGIVLLGGGLLVVRRLR